MTVRDLIFLDDLRSLELPWIDRLTASASSHEDVGRVWAIIRCWGPNNEDAEDLTGLAARVPHFSDEVEKIQKLIRLTE
ncbi:MAG TPA: hypothetical protein VEH82_06190, partial [Acidimicrobiales bacterium]|nr:hypothetical protein [Acidimicrobiales bacterium]